MSFSLFPRSTELHPSFWEYSTPYRRTSDIPLETTYIRRPQKTKTIEPNIELSSDETPNQRIIRAITPGFSRENVFLELEDRLLTITGINEQNGRKWRVSKSILLPESITGNELSANFEKGVLEISFPKTNAAVRIPIRGEYHWMRAYPPVIRKRPRRAKVPKRKARKLTPEQLLEKRTKESTVIFPGYRVKWAKNLPYLFKNKIFVMPNLEQIWTQQTKRFPGYTLELLEGITLLFEGRMPTWAEQVSTETIKLQKWVEQVSTETIKLTAVEHKIPIFVSTEANKAQQVRDQREHAIPTTGLYAK